MNRKLVPLNLKKSVTLPQAVIIPLSMHSKLGVERRLMIQTRTQEVPTALRDWLRGDKRYAGWFDEDAPGTVEPAAPKVIVDDGEQWSETMVVPVLHEYAARHGVELGRGDRKDDILTKLRADERTRDLEIVEPAAPEETPVE